MRRIDWARIRAVVRQRLPSLAPALTAPGSPLVAGAGPARDGRVSALGRHGPGAHESPPSRPRRRAGTRRGRWPSSGTTSYRPGSSVSTRGAATNSGGSIPSTGCSWTGAPTCTGRTCSRTSWPSSTSARAGRSCWTSGKSKRSSRSAPRRSAETLQAQGGWRLVFTEREAVVFVRESDANRPLLARLARQSREAVSDDREATLARRSASAITDTVSRDMDV